MAEGGGFRPEGGAGGPRPRMVFKKRDPDAAAKLEEERLAKQKSSPFGDAKPRETVIAKRTGKNEAEILQAEAETYEVKLRLTSEQFAEKKERLDQIEELKATIQTGEPDEVTAAEEQLAVKEAELKDVLKAFEKVQIEKAKAGELERPPPRNEVAGGREGVDGGDYGGGAFGSAGRAGRGGGDYGGGDGGYGGAFGDRRAGGGGGGGDYGGQFNAGGGSGGPAFGGRDVRELEGGGF